MLLQTKIGWKTAAGLVIASMIGTGVFTSLGFQVLDLKNTWSIIILWVLGGVMALIGAFSYAELGTHFKNSGGDYIFLSKIFHPFFGYLYAWISLTVGFSAPVAIAAMALGYYLSEFISVDYVKILAVSVILLVSVVHSFNLKQSGRFQDGFTLIKVLFVLVLIILGLLYVPAVEANYDFSTSWQQEILKPGFAVSLVYVFFAYTGWNAAAYIVDEIRDPLKDLPRALIGSTFFVVIVYVLLQLVFLKHASIAQLQGNVEVAVISFSNIFPKWGSGVISLFIAIQLIGTISSYIWVGPRITHAMAKDFKLWKPLSGLNKNGIPVRALWLNTAISVILALSGSFENILLYAGFVLQIMGTLSVVAVIFIKKKEGVFFNRYKPYPQLIYLVFSAWVTFYVFTDRPWESIAGFAIIGVGAIIYLFDTQITKS